MVSRDLNIGARAAGGRFRMPAHVVTETMAVVGVRGRGKTVTVAVVVEELLERGQQVVVIDPTDVWWGLKSSADGSAAGYPVVVLGGPHGDLPLDESAGAAIADFVVDRGASLVLSLRHLRKAAQRKFVTAFAEQLYHRKGEVSHRTALFIAIDECSTFIPQKVCGAEARMVGAIEDLVRKGRASGLGVALIDQRPASINKDVLTQLEVLVCHRITSPQDRKALLEWINQHDSEGHRAQFLENLASLPTGTAWFWSPGLDVFELVRVRMRSTFDSSKTPKPGEKVVAPKKLAAIDLEVLRSQLEDAVQDAIANDPKELRRRITQLEKELRHAHKAPAPPDQAVIDRAVAGAVAPLHAELEALSGRIHRGRGHAEQLLEVLRNGDGSNARTPEHPPSAPPPGEAEPVPAHTAAPATARAGTGRTRAEHRRRTATTSPPRTPAPRTRPADSAGNVSRPQQKVLDALAAYEGIGDNSPDRAAVAAIAGYKQGGHFNNTVSSLKTAELLDYPTPGSLALTDAGRAAARNVYIPSLYQLHEFWMQTCNGPQQRVLQAVLEEWPDALSREALAEIVGMRPGGHFNNTVSSLKTLGALEYPAKGFVRATDLLFPEGLT